MKIYEPTGKAREYSPLALNIYKGLDKQVDWHDFLLKTVNLLRSNSAKFYIKVDLAHYAGEINLSENEIDPDYYNNFEL